MPFKKQLDWPGQKTGSYNVDFSSVSGLLLIICPWKGREKHNFVIIGARKKNEKILRSNHMKLLF